MTPEHKQAHAVRAMAEHTAWSRNLASPLRSFMNTEISGAIVLLIASVTALVWANVSAESYSDFWHIDFSISLGSYTLGGDLHYWVNDALMALFFLVIGLEVRREFDMGELRDRRRLALPALAAIGGMAIPAAIYLIFTGDTDAAKGWGIVTPTDTAFALGMLALFGRRLPARLRVFVLTLVIADDIGALLVIAFVYSTAVSWTALAVAVMIAALALAIRRAGTLSSRPYEVLGFLIWIAVAQSGVHPTIAGVLIGLAVSAKPPTRKDLERATSITRLFREQPSAELAQSARLHVQNAVSANERLQHSLHPWTSFVIVPIFALANAGVVLSSEILRDAVSSPVTLGIFFALVVGKVLGIGLITYLAAHPKIGRLPSPVEIGPVLAAAAFCGIGFTLSLFIAEIAFEGQTLAEAKIGILGSAIVATALGALLAMLTPKIAERRGPSAVTPSEILKDLATPLDPERDHVRGPAGAIVELVEYGDYECGYCGRAETAIRQLMERYGNDLTYAWRHLPLQDVHPNAEMAAEAAEAAADQGKFWEMHDQLMGDQRHLALPDIRRYAETIELDTDRFWDDLRSRRFAERIAKHVETADESYVTGTPSFFINGRRHEGAYDLGTLTALVEEEIENARRGARA